MRAIVIESEGRIEGIFSCINVASKYLNATSTTVKKRTEKGTDGAGKVYRWATEEESKMFHVVKEKPKVERKPVEPKKYKLKELDEDLCDNMELDSTKYTIVPYKLIAGRVCVTPCPFTHDIPKPKVGSCLCVGCSSFHGRNRVKQQVACSASNGRGPSKSNQAV